MCCIWLTYCFLAGSLASIYRPVYHTSTMSTVDCIVLERLDLGIHHFDCSGLAEVLLKSTLIAAAHQDLPVLHWFCFLTNVDFNNSLSTAAHLCLQSSDGNPSLYLVRHPSHACDLLEEGVIVTYSWRGGHFVASDLLDGGATILFTERWAVSLTKGWPCRRASSWREPSRGGYPTVRGGTHMERHWEHFSLCYTYLAFPIY